MVGAVHFRRFLLSLRPNLSLNGTFQPPIIGVVARRSHQNFNMSTWLGALFHTSSSQPAKPVARPNPHIQHHNHQLHTISHASPRHTHRHTPSNALQPLPPMKPSVPIGGSNWGSCGPTTSYSKGNLAGDFKSQAGANGTAFVRTASALGTAQLPTAQLPMSFVHVMLPGAPNLTFAK